MPTIKANATLYRPKTAIRWRTTATRGSSGTRRFRGENPATGAQIAYSLGRQAQSVTLTIHDVNGKEIRSLEAPTTAGLHIVNWNLRQSAGNNSRFGRTAPNGNYLVKLKVNDEEQDK